MQLYRTHCCMIMRVSPKHPGPVEYTKDDERAITSQYICARTAMPVGPDRDTVQPETCLPGRSCYSER